MAKNPIKTLADLKPDPDNINRGTERGTALLERSLRDNGLARSIVADRDGVVLAGNKTLETAAALGFEKVVEVETAGDTLVVVRRSDLKAGTPEAVRLAASDNRTSEVNYDPDFDALLAAVAADEKLAALYDEGELSYMDKATMDFLLEEDAAHKPDSRHELAKQIRNKQTVRAVIASDSVATFERALAATGLPNRAEALLLICQRYLDDAGQFDFSPESLLETPGA